LTLCREKKLKMELKFLKTGPDETGNELQPGDEITDPDPVEIPEEEMQVGDIQDESQDESQDEAARRSRS
jgi:hypothetical protein